jgi:hypothetical protein
LKNWSGRWQRSLQMSLRVHDTATVSSVKKRPSVIFDGGKSRSGVGCEDLRRSAWTQSRMRAGGLPRPEAGWNSDYCVSPGPRYTRVTLAAISLASSTLKKASLAKAPLGELWLARRHCRLGKETAISLIIPRESIQPLRFRAFAQIASFQILWIYVGFKTSF